MSDERSYSGFVIDGAQYAKWDRQTFQEMRDGGVDCVNVTIVYWETARDTLSEIGRWNRFFERHNDLIMPAQTGNDIRVAKELGKTAITFAFQHCSPIEEDIDLVEIMHTLGVRFMQLSYNNQSVCATGCYEEEDPGITRFGRQVIREMNRVGMVIDMSHSGERSTFHAIELSERPITITHANPKSWHPALRNKTDNLLTALAESGGMLGFSMYPFHMKGKSNCTIESFCEMIARTADLIGIEHIGIGSDLVQGHPNEVVEWMRNGRWSKETDFGEGTARDAGWPDPVSWFTSNQDFPKVTTGLRCHGFGEDEVDRIMGGNWLRFFDKHFGPA
ncbi:membrane dipeptidase [Ponticaulis sp.]|uniref:membrane dipeptidase n=1 Tax=Ponticaulis sp. TaxID=2020902 RepID=UPI000C61A2DA|nr:membrane dipeptidase [Ponticaulis sp.]MBN06164.1 peptidase M19 [Ponticaulis sp.]